MYWIDPIGDCRWTQFVERHSEASVFHTASWLQALRSTYGYWPIALTSCAPGVELNDGIPFCTIKSWISGSRLVSLPFSDHCQPLLKALGELPNFISYLYEQCRESRWKYIEIRPREIPEFLAENRVEREKHNQAFGCAPSVATHQEYDFHQIDLRADLHTIFNNFHKNCIQRKIQRAGRENLEYEIGRSDSNLENFYHLLLLTRRRHRLPPQPAAWFRSLRDSFGESLTIRLAFKDGRAIASILTLTHKNTVLYKYGCSDATLHNLGAMPMLFWRAIQEEKHRGAQRFDLGRSDLDNPGLSAFKEHLGGERSRLTYVRLGSRGPVMLSGESSLWLMRKIFARMPGGLAQMAGSMLYRHMG
jgi:hypothetical protein